MIITSSWNYQLFSWVVHLKPASTSSLRVQCTMPVGCTHWKCGCLDRSSDSQHSRRRVYFRCASLLWFCTWGRGSRQLAHLAMTCLCFKTSQIPAVQWSYNKETGTPAVVLVWGAGRSGIYWLGSTCHHSLLRPTSVDWVDHTPRRSGFLSLSLPRHVNATTPIEWPWRWPSIATTL